MKTCTTLYRFFLPVLLEGEPQNELKMQGNLNCKAICTPLFLFKHKVEADAKRKVFIHVSTTMVVALFAIVTTPSTIYQI